MKLAIVHEWLVNYAGSEKCVESFINIWDEADIYTLVDFLTHEERNIFLKGKRARVSFIQKLPFSRKRYRNYLPLFPVAIEQFDLSKYDVILSSSHAVAKGAITSATQLHICYCHTPIRYAWDFYHQYLIESNLKRGIKSFIAKSVLHYIRLWDYQAAQRVDHFIANSKYIARRIKKNYGRESDVIYPPVDINKFDLTTTKDKYYLTVSRFVPYKRIDLIVEAFAKMPERKLIVIGEGPETKKIKSLAAPNIEILGHQPFEKLKLYMENAKAFIFAAEEDFGIIMPESLACGTPVIAFNKGGASEIIEEKVNGLLFTRQSPESIIDSVKLFEKHESVFDPASIRQTAEKFSRSRFEKEISNFVFLKFKEFQERLKH